MLSPTIMQLRKRSLPEALTPTPPLVDAKNCSAIFAILYLSPSKVVSIYRNARLRKTHVSLVYTWVPLLRRWWKEVRERYERYIHGKKKKKKKKGKKEKGVGIGMLMKI